MNCKKPALLTFLLILTLLVTGTWWFTQPTGKPEEIFTVSKGSNYEEIGNQLEHSGWIRSSLVWQTWGVLSGQNRSYFAGSYLLQPHMGLLDISNEIHKGNTYLEKIPLTIPEGSTIEQIASYIAETGLMTAENFLQAIRSYKRDTANPDVLYELEGYLFPETYYLNSTMTADDIIEMLRNQFDLVMKDIQIPSQFAYSEEELIILASIVEKESQDPEEIGLVAGVFLNRLQIDMALQSCATVNYILKQDKLILSEDDIAVDSPYNTYMYMGLPPGPVGNPGKAAIEAVLYPVHSDYYFFVAGPDGTHHFSETYEEHVWWTQTLWGD